MNDVGLSLERVSVVKPKTYLVRNNNPHAVALPTNNKIEKLIVNHKASTPLKNKKR